MKKLIPFALLLCAVSCSQTTSKRQYAFQQMAGTEPAQPAPAESSAAAIVSTNVMAADEQFHPARTNVAEVLPVEAATPRASTNAPVIVTAATTPQAASGMEEIIPAGVINFPAADLKEVLKIYSELVNRTVLQPANLGSPQITLKTQTPLTKREAIQAFEAVFALNGISMVNVGDKFVKVVPAAQVHQEGAPNDTRAAEDLPDLGQYVTHVVQLKYLKPSEAIPALQPFAKLNSILPIETSNILIVRDYTENVKRMLEMLAKIDIKVESDFISEVIPIKYAKVEEISAALNSLGAGGGSSGTVGTRPAAGGTQRQTTPGGGFNRPGGIGGTQPYGAAQPGGLATPGANPAGGSFTDRLQQIIRRASASGDLQLFGQMKIIEDIRSNSLLVFATRADMEMIKNVIAKLDVVLAQVLIETLILDVQIGHGWNYGISAGQPPRTNSIGGIGGVANNSGNPLDTLSRFFSGVAVSNAVTAFPAASGLTYFGRYNGNLDLAIQAAATDSRVNVVQRPQILTTHATPGSIFVGSTVPYVTSSSYGGAYGAGNSYQQLQVGIGLQVTPYINQDGLVVMQIDETIDEISGSISIANIGNVPTTTKRTLSAEVAVRDGETIILGGFIRNSDTKGSSGVPVLRSIPLLGELFRSRTSTKARAELLVLMRPSVLRTPEIAANATVNLKNQLPGVMRAEADVQAEEKKEAARARKDLFKRQMPLTSEEKIYYGKPPQ